MGYSPQGHKESDRTEQLTLNSALYGVQRCSGKNRGWGGAGRNWTSEVVVCCCLVTKSCQTLVCPYGL